MRKPPRKRITRAIYFHTNPEGERAVMNYSSIGDRTVQDWFQQMFAMERPPVIKVERASGHARRWECLVMDEAFLRSSAGANGFEVWA